MTRPIQVTQVSVPIAIVGVVLVAVVGWASAYFGNINAQASVTSDIKADVKILQNKQETQATEISTLTDGLERLNGNVVKLLIHNGIQPVK